MDDTAIDIRSLLGVLRRRWRLIVVFAILVVAGVGAFTFSLRPVYTAAALVLVDPSHKNLLDPDTNYSGGMSDSSRVDSEVEIARSDAVLMGVIDDLKLTDNSEFSPKLGLRERVMAFFRLGTAELPTGQEALNSVLGALQSTVTVQRRGLTYLIAIQARSDIPDRAAQIANSIAATYIEEQVKAKVNSTMASRAALQSQLEGARNNIVSADAAIDSYMDANIARIEAEAGNSTIGNLRAQIEKLEAAKSSAVSNANLLRQQIAQGDWQASANLLASQALADLTRQHNELTQQLAQANSTAPAAVNLRSQLAKVETQLADTANSELGSLQTTISQNEQQTETLNQEIRTSVLNSNLSSEVLTEFYGLQQRAQLARSQYDTLGSRVQDLDAQVSLQLPDSRIISPAMAPSGASFPNTKMMLLLGGLAGLGLGVGLAFVAENFVGGFSSAQQAESVLRRPVAASIPSQKRMKQGANPADQIVSAPLSAYSESIRRIRVGIEHAVVPTDEQKGVVIMVTSSLPGEGKTTTALALARSYAQSGKRTMLIDGDLRKPSLHVMLSMQPQQGLLEVLSPGEDEFKAGVIVQRDPASDATLLLGARRSSAATDQLVTSEGFKRVIRAARNSFDVVVVDTPPLQPVVDGLYVARLVDVVTFVVRWSSTGQAEAKSSLRALQSFADAPIVLVLNRQDLAGSAKSHGYSDYYVEES